MVLGVSDLDSYNLTLNTGATNNTNTFFATTSLSSPLSFGRHGFLYNTSAFVIAKTSPEKDKHSGQLGLSSELHYTNAHELSSGFVDAYVGAEVTANHTYNQTRELGYDIGLYTGVAKNSNGDTILVPKYGPHLQMEASDRENSHFTLDAALTAGLAVGKKLSDCETSVYAYGRGYQELTNNRNLHTEFGLGIGKPVEIFGAEANICGELGYGKNWSGGTTNNFVRRQDGVAARVGVSIDL